MMVRDPVCEMEIEPRRAAAMMTHEGRAWYFCSERCRDKFAANPGIFINKAPAMRLTVGVMGSADNRQPEEYRRLARALGQTIADEGMVLITGACPGLPYECAAGAYGQGGMSVGISPALSLDEHVHKYLSPSDAFDILIYTGSGLMGREVTNIRSSDIVVIVGGRSGTLGEFAIAYDEGKLIGVLEGTGGITAQIPGLEASFDKDTGATVLYDGDPRRLVHRLMEHYEKKQYRRPSCFCDETMSAGG